MTDIFFPVVTELSLRIRLTPHRSIDTAAMDGVSIRRCRKLSPFPHRFRSKLRRPIKKADDDDRRLRGLQMRRVALPSLSLSFSESSLRRTDADGRVTDRNIIFPASLRLLRVQHISVNTRHNFSLGCCFGMRFRLH